MADSMHGFDVVALKGVDARRLGFRKVFGPGDAAIIGVSEKAPGVPCILRANSSAMFRRIREESIVGFSIEDLFLDRKLIDMIIHEEKTVVFRPGRLTQDSRFERAASINKMRRILEYCVHSGAKTAVSTLAEKEEDVMSSMQLLLVAELIGAREEKARNMIEAMGEVL